MLPLLPEPGTRRALGRRILVDTNVWRYIVDLDGVEIINAAARDGCGQILACPAVLYEMLRFENAPLRRRLVKAICRSRWIRLMPEAFEESAELKNEIARLRANWILPNPDLSAFYKLYSDWHGSRGVWWRARTDPARAAAILQHVEGDEIDRGRNDARELRTQIGAITSFEKVTLDRWTSTFPLNPPGWDGEPVETWRAATMSYYVDALLNPRSAQSPAAREWLEHWIDLPAMRRDISSVAILFLYETDLSRLPRSWLRWALRTLQATRKTSQGTPVDNQIGSYLLDADVFVTADRGFYAVVERIVKEGAVPLAAPVLVTADNCMPKLTDLLA